MLSHQVRIIFWALNLFIITFNGFAATISDSCQDVSLLSITDRGSVANTPCVLPPKSVMLETGYQYKDFTQVGSLQNFPQPTLFLGLPSNSELIVVLPTYNQQSIMPFSGFSATGVGAKHKLTYGNNWVTAAEIFVTPPGGSAAFGNKGLGVFVNGMASYSINSNVSMTLMLGGSTNTLASFFGGERYNSFNPSLALTYALTEKANVFLETFAQTQTGPSLSGNYNVDCGVLYLLTTNVVLDLEVGQQLSHQIASFNQFIGGGVSVKL